MVAEGWAVQQQDMGVYRGSITSEAAGYLIGLLDPMSDATERQDLRAKIERLQKIPRMITPIAIPLADQVGVGAIVDPLARVQFDADGSGWRREWTWITRDAGWLVYDPNGTGQITSALRWFGNVTFWLFWDDGYEALAALDDDADGELADEELRHLAIWHDRNGNGLSERGEVRLLASHGFVALSTTHVSGDGITYAAMSPQGARLTGGRTRPTYDVLLRSRSISLSRTTE